MEGQVAADWSVGTAGTGDEGFMGEERGEAEPGAGQKSPGSQVRISFLT